MPARKKKAKPQSSPPSVEPTTAAAPETDKTAVNTEKKVDKLTPSFPIVGIGASAGGLAAFESFFAGMPTDSDPGMAFVLVQHLAPDHKSILSELIRRYTRMKVYEVEDGMTVKPNCAYIIPPNRDMAFIGNTLQLLEPVAPRGQRMAIDFFFRSLAQDLRERAMCIVLSGTGSDGTLGVRAIKGEGGMVMAQTPESTEYDGMPRSAIATGLVDYELPPAEMAAQLIAYTAHAFGLPPRSVSMSQPKNVASLKKIFILLRNQTGHDFSQYKKSTVHRRIGRRMAVQQIDTHDAYVKYLRNTPAEIEALFRDLLIGVTSFFRDPDAFKALEERVIAGLFDGKSASGVIRVWVTGCSTGEEAYSIAILLAEHQERIKQTFKVQIFATDIDGHAIATARTGIYPASIAADVSAERLARYFIDEPENSAYGVHKSIRDMLVFSEQNIVRDPPFSKIDLITCRNLMIYLNGDLQKKLIPLFHYALAPEGTLFLGTSETIGDYVDLFATVDRKFKIYKRKDSFFSTQRFALGNFLPTGKRNGETDLSANENGLKKRPVREITEQAILQLVVPTTILVNGNGDIFYIHGRAGLFLEPAPGEAGINNILKMAREGLQRDLRMALHKVVAGEKVFAAPNLRVKTNGNYSTVNLTVHQLAENATCTEAPLYLVTLEEVPASSSEHPQLTDPATAVELGADTESCIAELQAELRAKEEYLQSSNEELETTNEELKSSSEEMQSVNEELQSTNEELETSKEELQSVNEELETVNSELENKVTDLSLVNNDMNNLLAGTGIGTIFVDLNLCILRYTPTATEIIHLIHSDIGRPVAHIVDKLLNYDDLLEDVQEVLSTLVQKEREVQVKSGAWYLMRILPYRTLSNVIEGAVLTFVDITDRKQVENSALYANVLSENIVDAIRDPLLVLDSTLRVILASRSFYDTFEVKPDTTVGQLIYELGNGQWDIPALRKLLEEILPENNVFNGFEVSHDFAQIGRRQMLINARRVPRSVDQHQILLAIEDVTKYSLPKKGV